MSNGPLPVPFDPRLPGEVQSGKLADWIRFHRNIDKALEQAKVDKLLKEAGVK